MIFARNSHRTVVVAPCHASAVARVGDARAAADVAERAVAVVAVELVGLAFVRDVQVEVSVGWKGFSVCKRADSRDSAFATRGSYVALLNIHRTL